MSQLVHKFLRARVVFNLVNKSSKRKYTCNGNNIKSTWPVHANFFSSPIIYRAKYTKNVKTTRNKDTTEPDSDSDQEEKVLDSSDKEAKVLSIRVNSLRADLIIKSGLNIARNKVETAFYESRIRVNEKKIFKKSEQLSVGDQVDLIRGASPSNSAFLVVSRVIIMAAADKEDYLLVSLKRFKSLLIENYADQWKNIS